MMVSLSPVDLADASAFQQFLSMRKDGLMYSDGDLHWFNRFPDGEVGFFDWTRRWQSVDPRFASFICADERKAGQLELTIRDDIQGCGYVSHIWVVPEYRSKSLGAMALREAEKIFKSHGLNKMRLTSHNTNGGATRFYIREGWSCLGLRPNSDRHLIWEKQLA